MRIFAKDPEAMIGEDRGERHVGVPELRRLELNASPIGPHQGRLTSVAAGDSAITDRLERTERYARVPPSALWMAWISASSSKGFGRYSTAPARRARSRVCASSWAVMKISGIRCRVAARKSLNSNPLIPLSVFLDQVN